MKFHQQPPIPAYEDLIRLLRILAEPDLYAEMAEALEKRVADVNAAIAGRERLSQLDVLEAQAAADRTSAATQLRAATAEAERIGREAEANAKELFAREEEARVNAVRVLEEAQAVAATIKEELDTRAVDLREAERQCNERLAEARKLYVEGNTLKAEYEERLAKLKQAMG